MPLVDCPDCGKQISTAAQACPHCGRPLTAQSEARRLEKEYNLEIPAKHESAVRSGFLTALGVPLFLGGIAGAVYYFAYFDTSIATPVVELFGQQVGGGRVQNLGLMQERQLGLIVSIVAGLVGLVALAIAQRNANRS